MAYISRNPFAREEIHRRTVLLQFWRNLPMVRERQSNAQRGSNSVRVPHRIRCRPMRADRGFVLLRRLYARVSPRLKLRAGSSDGRGGLIINPPFPFCPFGRNLE